MRYVILTPVRNEESLIGTTLESVAAQTILPAEWMIVDDGSTDGTCAILDAAATQHPWIRVLHRTDRGFRKPGTGVMEAVFDGLDHLQTKDWDFLVKLDADLSFAPDYFEQCLARFAENPKLGIGGGTICAQVNGEAREEVRGDPKFHVRGATKIYRRACWQAIGGLIKSTGWDTMDEVKANMLGWESYTFRDLKLVQLKPTGGADGCWRNYYKNGYANYIVGYHPLFMLAKCVKRIPARPFGKISLALWCGYLSGYFKRIPRPADREVVRYLRKQQMKALLLQKSFWT